VQAEAAGAGEAGDLAIIPDLVDLHLVPEAQYPLTGAGAGCGAPQTEAASN